MTPYRGPEYKRPERMRFWQVTLTGWRGGVVLGSALVKVGVATAAAILGLFAPRGGRNRSRGNGLVPARWPRQMPAPGSQSMSPAGLGLRRWVVPLVAIVVTALAVTLIRGNRWRAPLLLAASGLSLAYFATQCLHPSMPWLLTLGGIILCAVAVADLLLFPLLVASQLRSMRRVERR